MIPLTTIFQTDFVRFDLNREANFVQVTWLQQPSSELFRNETMLITAYALSNNYNRALFDVRSRDYLDISDQNWLVRDLFPLLKDRRIRLAYLVSTVGLEIMDTFHIHDSVINNPELKRHLEIDIFLDKEDALKWVLEAHYSSI